MIFPSVDFPAPFSPARPWTSPAASDSEASTTACTPPKCFETARTWSRWSRTTGPSCSLAVALDISRSTDLEPGLFDDALGAERILELFGIERVRHGLTLCRRDTQLCRLRAGGALGDDVAREPVAVEHALDRLAGSAVPDQLDLAELARLLDRELGPLDRLRGTHDHIHVGICRAARPGSCLEAIGLRVPTLRIRDQFDVGASSAFRGPPSFARRRAATPCRPAGRRPGTDSHCRRPGREPAERMTVGHRGLADEDLTRHRRRDRGVVRSDWGELSDDGDPLLDRPLDRGYHGVPVVGLDHKHLVPACRDRVLDLRDLCLGTEVRSKNLALMLAGLVTLWMPEQVACATSSPPRTQKTRPRSPSSCRRCPMRSSYCCSTRSRPQRRPRPAPLPAHMRTAVAMLASESSHSRPFNPGICSAPAVDAVDLFRLLRGQVSVADVSSTRLASRSSGGPKPPPPPVIVRMTSSRRSP